MVEAPAVVPCAYLRPWYQPCFSILEPDFLLACEYSGSCRYQCERRNGDALFIACSGWDLCYANRNKGWVMLTLDSTFPDVLPREPQHFASADEVVPVIVAEYFADWEIDEAEKLARTQNYAVGLDYLVDSARKSHRGFHGPHFSYETTSDHLVISAPMMGLRKRPLCRITLGDLARRAFADPTAPLQLSFF